MSQAVIKVEAKYWRDYSRHGGWPWTENIDLAARFDSETAAKILAYWNAHHHPTKYKPNGDVLTPATSLGGILPINGVVCPI